MSAYPIAGYLHLIAGIGLFVALGLEWALVVRLRDAETSEQARGWLSLTAFQRPVGLASLVLVLVAGLYMAVTAWGAVGWISVTVAALLLMMAFGAYNGMHLAPLEQALKNERGPLGPSRLAQVRNRLLLVSVHCRAGILLGVVALMKFKPDVVGSIAVIGIALVLGFATALPWLTREPAPSKVARESA
jgi:hypothetical protein